MMIMLALLSAIMGYSVIMRYIFNDSLSWAEEICRYLFVWSAFLSTSLCLRRRSSIKIDMLLLALPSQLQRIILIIGDAIMLAFFGYMFNGGIKVTAGMFESAQTSPALMLPMYFVFASTVVGFGLCIIRLLQRLYFLFAHPLARYHDHVEAGRGE